LAFDARDATADRLANHVTAQQDHTLVTTAYFSWIGGLGLDDWHVAPSPSWDHAWARWMK